MLTDDDYIRQNMKNGIIVHEVTDWNEFVEVVEKVLLDKTHYVWRGHKNAEWNLRSTISRIGIDSDDLLNEIIPIIDQDVMRTHLERFKLSTRGRRGNNPPLLDGDNEWWALGQHFGLATPLLDWTTSPFVAAYFAFNEKIENHDNKRAIYAIAKPLYIKKSESLSTEDRIEFIEPYCYENQRLVNQSGLFSKSPVSLSIEEWTEKNVNEVTDRVWLVKIVIPDSERVKILKMLNRMNINHLTLFPDLEGASVHCNKALTISKY